MRVLVVLSILLVACGDDGDGAVPDAGGASGDVIAAFTAVENPSNVLSRFVSWDTGKAVPTHLEVDCGDYTASFVGDADRTEHEVFVMGLYDGAVCELRAIAEGADVPREELAIEIEVGPLPEALPELTVDVVDEGAVAPGWTLFNLSNAVLGEPFKVVLVDAQGRYRWYHELAVTEPGSDNDTRVVSEGVLIGGTRGRIWPTIVGWDGNIVWQEEIHTHHDVRPDGSPDEILYLAGGSDGCPGGYWADAVELWDRELGDRVWRWHICDHYEPPTVRADWAHVNTIEHFPDEDALMISSRNQNLLMKIDRTDDSLAWTLGATGDIAVEGADVFYHQHAPEIQPDGNILLFDNGLKNVREHSRAIELSYDEQSMTAEVVWEFRPEPDIFAPIWGDADRLPNGNTLSTFGRRGETVGSFLIEVDAAATEVWRLATPAGWGVYRADRVADPPRGAIR